MQAGTLAKHVLGASAARVNLVSGGLGSGKSFLCSELASQLASSPHSQPVVVLTSTAKQQRELQQQWQLASCITVESIESCAARVLQQPSHRFTTTLHQHADLSHMRMIRDKSDLWAMFSSKLFQLPLSPALRPLLDPTANVGKILDYMGWLKKSNVSAREFDSAERSELSNLCVEWENLLAREGVYEPEDLIARAIDSLRENAAPLPFNDRTVLLVDDFHLLLPNQASLVLELGKRLSRGVTLFADLEQTDAYRPTARVELGDSVFRFPELEPRQAPKPTLVRLGGRDGASELDVLEEWITAQLEANKLAVICTRSGSDRDLLFARLAQRRHVQLLGGRDYWLESNEVRSLIAFCNLVLRGHLTADRDLFAVWTSPLFPRYRATEEQISGFANRQGQGALDRIAQLGDNGARLAQDLGALEQFASRGHALSLLCVEVLKQSGVLAELDVCFSPVAAGRIDRFCQLVQRIEQQQQQAASSSCLKPSSVEVLDYLDLYLAAGGDSSADSEDELSLVDSRVYIASMHTVCTAFPAKSVDSICLARATAQKLPLRRRPAALALPWDYLRSLPAPRLDAEFFDSPKDMDTRLLAAVAQRSNTHELFYSLEREELPSLLLVPAPPPSPARRKPASPENSDSDWVLDLGPEPTSTVNLSFSTLSVYESCPRKYWYSKVMGLVVPSNLRMVNGKALHYGIEAHYKARMTHQCTPSELLQRATQDYSLGFDRAIQANPEGFVSRQHLLQVKATGLDTVRAFHDRYLTTAPPNRSLVQAEQRFEFLWKEAGITLTGFIDLVERDLDTGELVLTDFKSNVPDRAKLARLGRNNDQLAMYAWFCEREWNQRPGLVGIESIETGERYEEPPPASFDRVQHKLVTAAGKIRQQEFAPTPSYMDCTFCSFNKLCKYSAV